MAATSQFSPSASEGPRTGPQPIVHKIPVSSVKEGCTLDSFPVEEGCDTSDIYNDDKKFRIRLAMEYFMPDSVSVFLRGSHLLVHATRLNRSEDRKSSDCGDSKELCQAYILPKGVDTTSIKAVYEGLLGILEISGLKKSASSHSSTRGRSASAERARSASSLFASKFLPNITRRAASPTREPSQTEDNTLPESSSSDVRVDKDTSGAAYAGLLNILQMSVLKNDSTDPDEEYTIPIEILATRPLSAGKARSSSAITDAVKKRKDATSANQAECSKDGVPPLRLCATSDVFNDLSQFRICLDVRQFKPDEISIIKKGARLIVHVRRIETGDDPYSEGNVARGSLRSYILPSRVDPGSIKATYFVAEGVLEISGIKTDLPTSSFQNED